MAISNRILRPADDLDPLQIGYVNGCGNFYYDMDRPRISRAAPNKHPGQPEFFFRYTRKELAHDRDISSDNKAPQGLYGFSAQKIGDFHDNVIITFLVTTDSRLRMGKIKPSARETSVRSVRAGES